MSRTKFFFVAAMMVLLGSCGGSGDDASADAAAETRMTFFLTSAGSGNGADLGGLVGADQRCEMLADAAGAGDLTWHAYLSASATADAAAVNARDRIGSGPWYNHALVQVASDIANLHGESNGLTKESVLNEMGGMTNGRGDDPNRHDILTGSELDGTALGGDDDTTCQNWTGSGEGSARVGHFDRQGGGDNPTSWNNAHASRGCSQEDLQGSGGDGLYYCFAIDRL